MKYWFKNVADNIYIYPKSAPRNLILQTRTSDCNSAPLNKLYSYDTFLKMDILKKIIKPKNFSLILLEEVSDNFWNWEL